MDDILKLADDISNAIKSSKIYQDYELAYNHIKSNKEIMNRVNQLKKSHLEFSRQYKSGNYDFNREKYLSQEFYKAMLDEDVKTYFMNEEKLVDLLSQVCYRMTNGCMLNVFTEENL